MAGFIFSIFDLGQIVYQWPVLAMLVKWPFQKVVSFLTEQTLLLLATLVIYNHFLLKLDFNDSHCLRSKAPSFTIGNMQNGSFVSLKLTLFSKSTLISKVLGFRNVQDFGGDKIIVKVFWCYRLWQNLMETSPHSPMSSSGPESTLKCLAHGRGVVPSSQPSTFKRVSLF